MAKWNKSIQLPHVDLLSVRCVTYASVAVFIATILITLSLATPYWLESETIPNQRFRRLGLWEACFIQLDDIHYRYDRRMSGCRWIFDEDYSFLMDFLEPTFFIATQILFSLGFLFIIFTCIGVLALQQCFVVDRESYAIKILSLISVLSAVCCTSAVSIFALYGNEEDWMPDPDHNYFSWSFVSALLGSILLWIASLLFYIESRLLSRQEKQSHRDFSRGSRA